MKSWLPSIASAIFLTGCSFFWRSPAYYTDYRPGDLPASVLTQAEYDAVHESYTRPYIVTGEVGNGTVLVFGATHTKNPEDPQLRTIDSLWRVFQPTIALIEGRPGFFAIWSSDLVKKFGEGGYVYSLARRDGIETRSWEPPFDLEIDRMTAFFPPKQIALFYVLRPYFGAVRFGKPADAEGFVEPFLEKRTQHPKLKGTLTSIVDIDRMWSEDFQGLKDWRETSDEYGWPGYLNAIASRSNAFRDEHCAHVILDLAARGNRVFVVAGSSHAVRLEPVVRAAFRNAP